MIRKRNIHIGVFVAAVAAGVTAIAEVITPGTIHVTVPLVLAATAAGVTAAVNAFESNEGE